MSDLPCWGLVSRDTFSVEWLPPSGVESFEKWCFLRWSYITDVQIGLDKRTKHERVFTGFRLFGLAIEWNKRV